MKSTGALVALASVLALGASVVSAPAQAAAAKVCKIAIAGTDQMQFDQTALKVGKDCTEVEVTLTHTGKLPAQAMGHNWTLVKTADLTAVATDGLGAGIQNDYIKPGDSRVIAHTKIVGGGETATVKFSTSALKAGESYSYLCTFPGHSSLMKGTLTIG